MSTKQDLDRFRNERGRLENTIAHCGKSKQLVYRLEDDRIVCWNCANKIETATIVVGYDGNPPVAGGGVYQLGPPIKCEICDRIISAVVHANS